ncbi:immunoglobulin superfamily member 23 [Pteronotus mesoamericanus]|uniref:immunoglobulin superfamily member 23 n=1 Tax=Pteronotus mesoamericanus TaxID=1884717 RepID=UPI0023EAEC27|nr:immunoglobulin superfamily member 23 [Pteronotus parnellii mesoamericanus]
MRCLLNASSVHSPAWKRLLLTGALLASCIRSASSELPSSAPLNFVTEGASAHLPVPSNLDGILSTSWFRGHEARPEAMIFSPEGLPGPGHTGRETLGTQGNLVVRNVTAQDSGSYTVVLETSRGRRSVTEQIHVKANSKQVWIQTYPESYKYVVQSELNYSVVLHCVNTISITPVVFWTFNGKPHSAGERLIIRRLSKEHLGSYTCVVYNNQQQYSSMPVTILQSEVSVDPTDQPIEPDSALVVSGASAIALILAGSVGMVALVAGICFTITQAHRMDRRRRV